MHWHGTVGTSWKMPSLVLPVSLARSFSHRSNTMELSNLSPLSNTKCCSPFLVIMRPGHSVSLDSTWLHNSLLICEYPTSLTIASARLSGGEKNFGFSLTTEQEQHRHTEG